MDTRILLLYPHDFTSGRRGVDTRFAAMIGYLEHRGFETDLLSFKKFESDWPSTKIIKGLPGIANIYLYNHSYGLRWQFIRNLLHMNFSANRNLLEQEITRLPDYAFPGLKKLFRNIMQANDYNYIIISYVQWARLLEDFNNKRVTKILTIEDSLSKNLAERNCKDHFYSTYLDEEVRRIGFFDHAICISYEEMKQLSPMVKHTNFHYIPAFMDPIPFCDQKDTDFDLLFVGSDHPSNKRGIAWFFNCVFPLLPEGTRILCVGTIVRYIDDYPGVSKVTFVEDITEAYSRSRIAIIPLLDGTGMKVKLVESLAHGVPLVTTTAGLSGIPDRLKKSFITADEPVDFAEAVVNLLTDQQFYTGYSGNLRKLFNEEFSTEAVTSRLDRIFLKES